MAFGGLSDLAKAIETATKAVEEDNNQNYNEAVRLYEQSVQEFMLVMTYHVISEKVKESMRVKTKLYADRAELIKKFLETNLVKAIETVTKATEEDNNKNYNEAVRLYEQGVQEFMVVMKYNVKSEDAKESIQAKIKLYADRAEKIKKSLEINIVKAIEIVTKATEEDRNKNYKEALWLYEQGVEALLHVMEYHSKSEEVKQRIRAKSKQYSERAEKIRKAINNFSSNAIENIIRAVEEDHNLNYELAMVLYKEADEYILLAIKHQVQEEIEKERMEAKRMHYLKRIETIHKLIDNDKSKNITILQDKVKQLNLEDVCVGEVPKVTWSDVVGLDRAKDTLKESVILAIKYSELSSDKKISWKGILLFGPPGTGKSKLGIALLNEVNTSSGYAKYIINLDEIEDTSEAEKLIKVVFETARENKPCIIFVDEIDLLCFSDSDKESELTQHKRNEFLSQMQGMAHDSDNILLLGATNKPWMLDVDILQYFEKRIYIPLPDEHTRLDMFKFYLRRTHSKLTEDDFKNLSKLADGYSGEDIVNVVDDILMQAIREVQTATHFKTYSGPCPKDPSKIVDNLITPCCPNDQGAIEMNFWNIDIDKLLKPPVTMLDIFKLLAISEATVNEEDLAKFRTFAESCGSKC